MKSLLPLVVALSANLAACETTQNPSDYEPEGSAGDASIAPPSSSPSPTASVTASAPHLPPPLQAPPGAGSTPVTPSSPVGSTATAPDLTIPTAPSLSASAEPAVSTAPADSNPGQTPDAAGGAPAQPSEMDAAVTSSAPIETTEPGETADAGSPAQPQDLPPTLIGDVAFSVPSQSFRGTLTVELSSALSGEIRFTTDGSLPTQDSPLYAGALALDSTTELRANVFANGSGSFVSSALYIARDFDTTSDLPLLIIDGHGGGKPTDKETYRRAAFMLFEPVDGEASFANLPSVATRSGHRLRGQSSQTYPKTPYRVELWSNVEGKDADHVLAGMPAEADWALISLYVDRSLMRNAFIYELGRQVGLKAPREAFVEVYINHDSPVVSESDYQGVYNLTETIENQKARVNLEQLKDDDVKPEQLSGGYIFSFEYAAVEGQAITCNGSDIFSRGAPGSFSEIPVTTGFCWEDLELRDPEPTNAEQVAWITSYLQQFHDALHAEPLGAYQDFIDLNSFVDYFLITELTRNMDAYIRSAYFHKERDGKIVAGPLWDYDLSMGAGGFFENTAIAGWQVANRLVVHDWFVALTRDPAFLELIEARWVELRQGPLADENIALVIDALREHLSAAALRDHEKWSVDYVRTQYSIIQLPAGDTWDAQVSALQSWVVQRAAWMDGEAGKPFDVTNYPYAPAND